MNEKQSQGLSSHAAELGKPTGPPPTAELLTSKVSIWQNDFDKGPCQPVMSSDRLSGRSEGWGGSIGRPGRRRWHGLTWLPSSRPSPARSLSCLQTPRTDSRRQSSPTPTSPPLSSRDRPRSETSTCTTPSWRTTRQSLQIRWPPDGQSTPDRASPACVPRMIALRLTSLRAVQMLDLRDAQHVPPERDKVAQAQGRL